MADVDVPCSDTETKTCSRCGENKPLSAFSLHYKKLRPHCKVCRSADTRKWYAANKDNRRSYYKKYAAENVEKLRGYRTKSTKKLTADPEWVAKRKAWHTDWWLKRNYNISIEQYQQMSDAQNGLCFLCCKRSNGRGKYGRLYVDHCHETGRVRGLLCRHCNTALGILGDTPEKMEKVMSYLRGTT